MPGPTPNKFNLVVSDMKASVAFYQRLGLDFPDTDAQWQHHHRSARLGNGIDIDLDSTEFANYWDEGWSGGMGVIGFSVEGREQVDEIYSELIHAGYRAQQAPYDA